MDIDAEAFGGTEKGTDCVYVGEIDNYIDRFGYVSNNLNAKIGDFGNIDNIIAISKNNIIIGYINYLTITDELFNEIINPNIKAYLKDPGRRDDKISGKQIAHWKDSNNLFILSIAIRKEYRDLGIIKILTDEFLNELRRKDKAGYKINSITADTVSEHGEKIMKMFRTEIVTNKNGPVILPAPNSDKSRHAVTVRICEGKNIKDLLKYGLSFNYKKRRYIIPKHFNLNINKNTLFINNAHFLKNIYEFNRSYIYKTFYKSRSLKTIVDMNNYIFKKWNEKLPESNIVYHLGNFSNSSLKETIKLQNKLNKKMFLILKK